MADTVLNTTVFDGAKKLITHYNVVSDSTGGTTKIVDVSGSNTTRIEISGLNGDNNNFNFSFSFVGDQTVNALYLSINGESTTSNHRSKIWYIEDDRSISVQQTITTGFYLMKLRSTNAGCYFGSIYAKTGQNRVFQARGVHYDNSSKRKYQFLSGYFSNTSDTITSLVFESSTLTSYKIVIWSD